MTSTAEHLRGQIDRLSLRLPPNVGLDAVGIARGLVTTLELLEIEVGDRGPTIVLCRSADLDATLGDDDPFALFALDAPEEALPSWAARAGSVAGVWTASRRIAERLASAGVAAHYVGACCQIGGISYHSRRALLLRDADWVGLARVLGPFDTPRARMLRETLQRHWMERHPFAKAGLVVDLTQAEESAVAAWERWIDDVGHTGVVLLMDLESIEEQLGVAACCDCEILLDVAEGFPWMAAATAFLGGDLAVPEDGSGVLTAHGIPKLPGIATYEPTPEGLMERLCACWSEPVDRRRARSEETMRRTMREFSAKACAVRLLDALRATFGAEVAL